jgi:aromatic ring-opening dioxygenase catalytic subunit (LigB family)
MGEIVGVGLVSHVPTIMLPPDIRRELNDGNEISLVPGLHRLKREVLEVCAPDTIVVLDTHWATTVELIVAAHERRTGHYTSEELPRGMSSVPYDLPGDPELAHRLAAEVVAAGSWATAIDDPYLPIHYGTVNLAHYLQGAERWLTLSTVQTGQPADYLLFGAALGRAIEALDRRVVILASGGMSHRFWPLRELRAHEASDPAHLRSPDARAADEQRLDWMRAGDHASIIDTMDDYGRFAPEGRFGHYLAMIAAVGGRESAAVGRLFSDYENSVGTGQVHVWFDRPESGWVRSDRAGTVR